MAEQTKITSKKVVKYFSKILNSRLEAIAQIKKSTKPQTINLVSAFEPVDIVVLFLFFKNDIVIKKTLILKNSV